MSDKEHEVTEEAIDPSNPYGVKVGQVWASCDWRDQGSGLPLTVLAIKDGKAQIQRFVKTWIRLDRFQPTSTGYRLIKDIR